MRKYKNQGLYMIKALEKKIEKIKLAESICKARYESGTDRIVIDIHQMMEEIEKLNHLDIASVYAVLVKKNII